MKSIYQKIECEFCGIEFADTKQGRYHHRIRAKKGAIECDSHLEYDRKVRDYKLHPNYPNKIPKKATKVIKTKSAGIQKKKQKAINNLAPKFESNQSQPLQKLAKKAK